MRKQTNNQFTPKPPEQPQYSYVRPNDHVFEAPGYEKKGVIPEGTQVHILQRLEYPETGGILSFYEGVKYPRKGLPFPKAIETNDICKRMTMFFINAFSHKAFVLPMIVFYFLPKKLRASGLNVMVKQYHRVTGEYLLIPYYLKDEWYCDLCRELREFLRKFMLSFGVEEYHAGRVSKTLVHFIQYDDAYRYRIEDICSCLTREEILENPKKAIDKAVLIYSQREFDKEMVNKIKNFARIAKLLFSVPKIKKEFLKAFKQLDFTRLQMDEADQYHTLIWVEYDYQGMTQEQRQAKYMEIHKDGLPPVLRLQRNK